IELLVRGLLNTKLEPSLKAIAVSASLSLIANITLVRFDGDRRTLSRNARACSPSLRSTIVAPNFWRFSKNGALLTSLHTSVEMASCCMATLIGLIAAASLDTRSALQIETEGAGAVTSCNILGTASSSMIGTVGVSKTAGVSKRNLLSSEHRSEIPRSHHTFGT